MQYQAPKWTKQGFKQGMIRSAKQGDDLAW
jgi:hypothetical protein